MTSRTPELTWTSEQVRRFWDYESNFPERFFTTKRGPEIVRMLKRYVPPGRTVLDFGCGAGALSEALLKSGYRVIAADASKEAVNRVRTRLDGQPGFVGAFEIDELQSKAFKVDAILIVEVIEHLYDDWLEEALELLKRLAQADTSLMFTTPNEEDLRNAHILCPCCNQTFHRWQHVRSWSEDSLVPYLLARGFEISAAFATDFGVSLRSYRGFLASLRKCFRYWRDPNRKPPHLVILASVGQSAAQAKPESAEPTVSASV